MSAKKGAKKAAKKAPKKKVAKKAAKKPSKKVTAKKVVKKAPKKAASHPVTREQIELTSYFIYLERAAKGLPGDSYSDWVSAEHYHGLR